LRGEAYFAAVDVPIVNVKGDEPLSIDVQAFTESLVH